MKVIWQTNLAPQFRIIRTLLAGGLLLGLLILFVVQPADLPFPTCAFSSITGHSCLTCGMTRSLHAISHGDLPASLRYHLLGPAAFIAMLLYCMIFSIEAISGKRLSLHVSGRMKKQIAMLVAIVWVVYWGARLITEYVR